MLGCFPRRLSSSATRAKSASQGLQWVRAIEEDPDQCFTHSDSDCSSQCPGPSSAVPSCSSVADSALAGPAAHLDRSMVTGRCQRSSEGAAAGLESHCEGSLVHRARSVDLQRSVLCSDGAASGVCCEYCSVTQGYFGRCQS